MASKAQMIILLALAFLALSECQRYGGYGRPNIPPIGSDPLSLPPQYRGGYTPVSPGGTHRRYGRSAEAVAQYGPGGIHRPYVIVGPGGTHRRSGRSAEAVAQYGPGGIHRPYVIVGPGGTRRY